MKRPDHFRLVITREKHHVAGSTRVGKLIAVVFIACVAAFFTKPVTEGPSAYDRPLPMPADIEPPPPQP